MHWHLQRSMPLYHVLAIEHVFKQMCGVEERGLEGVNGIVLTGIPARAC